MPIRNLLPHGGRLVTLLMCLGVTAMMPVTSLAWGDEGHRITARIAASFLTPAAAAQVGKLLRNDARNNPAYFKSKCPTVFALTSKAKLTKAEEATFLVEGLACVAPWPDPPVKDQRLYTANWHFVDIPVIMQNPGGPQRFTYEPARDCVMDSKRGDCAIQALERLQAVLRNQKVPNEKGREWGEELTSRSEALKFFVHILGDMHQPLHNVADKADVKAVNDPKNMGDMGGNSKYAEWFGDDKTPYGPMNLHSVWDSGFITHGMAVGSLSEDQYYRRLLQELKAGGSSGLAQMQAGDIFAWTGESYNTAVQMVYGKLPPLDPGCGVKDSKTGKLSGCYRLADEYYSANKGVVDQQLKLGGVRLARLLNEALGN